MPIVVNHQVPATSLIAALAGAFATQDARRQKTRDIQDKLGEQALELNARAADRRDEEFAYRQQDDQARRDHAERMMRENYDLQQQSADAALQRLPERIGIEQQAEDDAEDRRYSRQQQRLLAQLDNAELVLQNDADFADDERAMAMEQIARRRRSIQTANAVSAKDPFPKGQGIGQVWTDPNSKAQYSRDSKGDVKLLHKDSDSRDLSDEQLLKHRAQLRKDLTIQSAEGTPTAPSEEQLDQAMLADMQWLAAVRASRKSGQPLQSRAANQPAPSTPSTPTNDPSSTPQGRASDPIGKHITPQGRAQLAQFIPENSELYNLPQGLQLQAGNINGKPGTITIAEAVAACARYKIPFEKLAELLQLQPMPGESDAAVDESISAMDEMEERPVSMIGGYE